MSIFIGIDPGASGGIAFVDHEGRSTTMKLKDATERDIVEWFPMMLSRGGNGKLLGKAVIERVSSSPQMGVVSAFTFGRSYGFLRGVLAAAGVPYVEVTPQKWQKAMGCLSKGNKNVTKQKAQQLYPQEKITHAVADALLLATYCKHNHAQLF